MTKNITLEFEEVLCHQWIVFGKGQGLSLYYQKVVIKFDKILKIF